MSDEQGRSSIAGLAGIEYLVEEGGATWGSRIEDEDLKSVTHSSSRAGGVQVVASAHDVELVQRLLPILLEAT